MAQLLLNISHAKLGSDRVRNGEKAKNGKKEKKGKGEGIGELQPQTLCTCMQDGRCEGVCRSGLKIKCWAKRGGCHSMSGSSPAWWTM